MTMNIDLLIGKSAQHIHWLSPTCGIHHKVVESWQALFLAAKKQGFDLTIASGFRDFNRQLLIWNKKFSGQIQVKDTNNQTIDLEMLSDVERVKAILTFSALPGASRHHWGTDIDVYATNLLPDNQKLQLEPWEYEKSGPFASLSEWLVANAEKFGFYLPYDKYRGGIAAEPWHLSYFPLAKCFQSELTPELLSRQLSAEELLGKSAILGQLNEIFQNYINNIGEPSDE